MFLLVPAHLGCPGQNPESHKMVVCVCVCMCACVCACVRASKLIRVAVGCREAAEAACARSDTNNNSNDQNTGSTDV